MQPITPSLPDPAAGDSPEAALRSVRLAVLGAGKLGRALVASLAARGTPVLGPFGRTDVRPPADVYVLAVPERELAALAAAIPVGPIVGHCSASEPLDVLAPHERFNLHPLLPLTHTATRTPRDTFVDAAGAIDGSSPRARDTARALALGVGMRPVYVAAALRPLYHAAASMAANYLVTLEDAARQLAALTGITRADLAPLARASLESWIAGGFAAGISGPVSRGDEHIVEGQRRAVAEYAPELLPLFDVLTDATRAAMHRQIVEIADPPMPMELRIGPRQDDLGSRTNE